MHHPATPTPRKATTADPVAGAVAMVAAAEATAAVVVSGAVAVAEEVDGNSLLIWRSRCVMMIPKRSNLLQQRPSAAIFISQHYLYNTGRLQSRLEHGPSHLVQIKPCTPTP